MEIILISYYLLVKTERQKWDGWTNVGTNRTVQIFWQFDIGRWVLQEGHLKWDCNHKKGFYGQKEIVYKALWSVWYGKTWTLMKADVRWLEAFNIWIWRRMEKISWVDKISNEEVLTKKCWQKWRIDRLLKSSSRDSVIGLLLLLLLSTFI